MGIFQIVEQYPIDEVSKDHQNDIRETRKRGHHLSQDTGLRKYNEITMSRSGLLELIEGEVNGNN